ncbi:HSP20-like chaperones superfamily protein [Striga asiatica]|uniref:HSP20-like chaperones superfamily protein n=1 Tax=Striga asiatica TaxID=4170 RepID=A0A5A7PVS7_STRAF|nr:HSP20-like chaperones superfamily protein [Striga asiatica]
MDSLDAEKVKKITWKRSRSRMDVKTDSEDSSITCKEVSEKRPCYDSTRFSSIRRNSNLDQQFVLPVLTTSKVDKWCSDISTVITGTACRGRGPPVGSVDIGVGKSSYYFCIALPGVKQEPGEFECDIQKDGKVWVRGVTSTGRKIVNKHSRVFEMKIQQQCSPGPFTLFFSLPGPVNPALFRPNFRSDGIFEAVVTKI